VLRIAGNFAILDFFAYFLGNLVDFVLISILLPIYNPLDIFLGPIIPKKFKLLKSAS
jgi:hypothetical protein